MSNDYHKETLLWIVTTTGDLQADGVTIMKVVFFPGTKATDTLVLTDTDDKIGITLKANEGNVDMVELDFGRKGKRMSSLKVGTIGGGFAHIHLAFEL